ncbi:DUF4382 domain-containing protein [Mucilaginibacter sp. Bleaf8]|uniref:DUF4382 domain-containing protein n=1 Tax=Mucilaginibacter sp. Bleaf8 TaxID=2834430 RepID=UPI001BCB1C29|nr:DUF4382 domain-containing protein [Mucilaginibacter sp. Bleaf8]MBS7563026.1 DUF4382 domain-containing protein [Mucilaginibacter sp. Bleaf8]
MKKLFLFTVTAITLAFTACKKDNDSKSSQAHVTVRLTDAPGAYDAVILSIKQVVILSSGGERTVDVNGGPIDILRFRQGRDTVLAGVDVPAGRLQEVRLVLNNSGNRVVIGGVSYDLNTPSGQTSGVKLKVQDNLTGGIEYTLLLDFDAAQSIVVTGNGKYNLKPVIRAIPQAVSGAITGSVSPIASYPKVYAIMGTDTVGTVTDANGKFYFPGLPAGTYRINFVPVSPYSAKTIDGVVVTNGSVKDIGSTVIQ